MVLPGNNIKVESGRIINNEQTNNNLKMKENTKEISNQYFFMNQMANTNIVMRVWDLSMDHLFVFLNPAYERPQLIIAMYDSSYISQLYKIHSTLESKIEFLLYFSPFNQLIFSIFKTDSPGSTFFFNCVNHSK